MGSALDAKNDDVIANVAHAIMRAEHDFDPTRGCKRVTLRCTYGRRAIIKEFRTLNRMSKDQHTFLLIRSGLETMVLHIEMVERK